MPDQTLTGPTSVVPEFTPPSSRIRERTTVSLPKFWRGQRLLSAMWRGSDRQHQIAVNDPEKGFRNIPVTGTEDAIRLARSLGDAARTDIYFACAEYVTSETRTADHAAGTYAFWIDIDCGPQKAEAGKGYATVDLAVQAIGDFCQTTGLPTPTHEIGSGGGIHCYWVLTEFLPKEQWQNASRKLKALTKTCGLLADPSRTADIASVLRIPGTSNHKYDPPLPVVSRRSTTDFCATSAMLEAIDAAYEKLCLRNHKEQIANSLPEPQPLIPLNFERLSSALKVVNPDCDESTWKLHVLAPMARQARANPALADSLRELARQWSSGALRGEPSLAWTTPGQSNGRTGEAIFEEVWHRFLTESYDGVQTTLGTIFYMAKEAGWVDDVEAFEHSQSIKAPKAPQPLDPRGFPHCKIDRSGEPHLRATIENLGYLVEKYDIPVRFNVIKKKLHISIPNLQGTPENYHNTAIAHIFSLATLNGIGTTQISNYIEAIGDQHPINPAADWINSRAWDGQDRLPDVYSTLVAREDFPEPLKYELLYRWLLSVVAAAMMPGFHCRGVLTLQGAQGIGKTSWFRRLINDQILREDLVLLGHHLDVANKDSLTTAICHWIVELGELDSSFRRDVARLKGFITASHDKIRRPYGRTDSEYPRRTVFCASVNEETFLVDSTGNTRFWTLPVVQIDYNHDIDMQQVFAQLAVDLKQDEKWWLSPEMDSLLTEQNNHHTASSIVEEKVLAALDRDRTDAEWVYKSASEMLEEAGILHPQNPQCRECGSVLRRLFGNPKKINGIMKWRVPIANRPSF